MFDIGDVARAYFHSEERCEELRQLEPGKIQMLLLPAVTNRAFASELYLKALLGLEGISAWGHDLNELFSQLTQQRKDSIRVAAKLDPALFEKELKENANLFVEWRYLYEKPADKI